MKIFLICPVRKDDPITQRKIRAYVLKKEKEGHKVHWPKRDTKQTDPTGGLQICKTNFKALIRSDEIHIWYDETSNGSKFDFGGTFMYVYMLGNKKRVFIVNEEEAMLLDMKSKKTRSKSFLKVMKHLAD